MTRFKSWLLRGTAGVSGLAALLVAVLWWTFRPPEMVSVPPDTELTLGGVTVVNPGRDRRPAATVTIRDGIVQRIAEGTEGPGAGRYEGHYLLPGLIDLHTHLPPDTPLNLTEYVYLLYLRYGVTAVRDAGDTDGTALAAARSVIGRGRAPGPRIFGCGPFVGGGPPRWRNTVTLDGPGSADSVVAALRAQGVDCLKVYEDLTVEEIRALVDAARREGLPVIGHVPTALPYEEALVPNVAHLLGVPPPPSLRRDHIMSRTSDWQAVDDARLDVIVQATLAHGIINTPTLVSLQALGRYGDYEAARDDTTLLLLPRLFRDVVWHPTEGLPFHSELDSADLQRLADAFVKKMELVRRLYQAGATLHVGTDAMQPFVIPGLSVHQEMRFFTDAGIPAERIWEMATREAGIELGVPGLGTIEEGAPADLLIFSEDPTEDLAGLDSIVAVIARGRLYSREELDRALRSFQDHMRGWLYDWASVEITRVVLGRTVERDY